MKDEIKEIKLLNDIANGNYKEVISKEAKNLLDYITNLQEQLRKASLDIQELTERDLMCPTSCDKLTNLQDKIKQYEDPEDLTLFHMWLDEKAKDKMKQLQDRIKELEQINEEHRKLNGELRAENKELKMTNLALADDITKNKIIKQEVLTECCGIPIGEIPMLKIQNDEYKQRIDEAIEYIKSNLDNTGWLEIGSQCVEVLINLLQGSDE